MNRDEVEEYTKRTVQKTLLRNNGAKVGYGWSCAVLVDTSIKRIVVFEKCQLSKQFYALDNLERSIL